MSKGSVLFLYPHNAGRSQMAEALLRNHAVDRFDVASAGLEPTAVHLLTICAMNEIGEDLSAFRAKGLNDFLGKTEFNFAVIVCERTKKSYPHI